MRYRVTFQFGAERDDLKVTVNQYQLENIREAAATDKRFVVIGQREINMARVNTFGWSEEDNA